MKELRLVRNLERCSHLIETVNGFFQSEDEYDPSKEELDRVYDALSGLHHRLLVLAGKVVKEDSK